ncbi:MAG: twin-arginine translocation signal domain-containing protein [Candidatus Pacearchaeota archaeon]
MKSKLEIGDKMKTTRRAFLRTALTAVGTLAGVGGLSSCEPVLYGEIEPGIYVRKYPSSCVRDKIIRLSDDLDFSSGYIEASDTDGDERFDTLKFYKKDESHPKLKKYAEFDRLEEIYTNPLNNQNPEVTSNSQNPEVTSKEEIDY